MDDRRRWIDPSELSVRPSPSSGLDFDLSLVQLRSRDLVEIWVPDVLGFADALAEPEALKAQAAARIAGSALLDAPTEIRVPKSPFFSRPAVLLSLEDRLAFHAAVLSVADRIERALRPGIFAARVSPVSRYLLRPGPAQWLSWQRWLREGLAADRPWMVMTDITAYFDNVQHRYLFST